MTRLPVILALAFWVCACDSYAPPGSPSSAYGFPSIATAPTLPDSVSLRYVEDAALLTFGVVRGVEGELAGIELPPALRETLYNALGHVWHATHLPERDSVVAQFDIHPFPLYSVHRFFVAVDFETDWIQAWVDGNVLTGHPQVDELVGTWDLILERTLDTTQTYRPAILLTEEPRNTLALSFGFVGIDGVRYAEPSIAFGDGHTIQVAPRSDAIELVYSYGFGDCPAGCISRHYWRFRVGVDGNVKFVESYGSPLP